MRRLTLSFALIFTGVCLALTAYAQSALLTLRVEKKVGYDQLKVDNHSVIPLTVRVWLSNSSNTSSALAMPLEKLVSPHSTALLNEFRPSNSRHPFYYTYQYTSVEGDPKASHDPHARYQVPLLWPDLRKVSQPSNLRQIVH